MGWLQSVRTLAAAESIVPSPAWYDTKSRLLVSAMSDMDFNLVHLGEGPAPVALLLIPSDREERVGATFCFHNLPLISLPLSGLLGHFSDLRHSRK